METIEVTVPHFYNHPVLYAFMSQGVFHALEEAYLHDQNKAIVSKEEFNFMIDAYLDTLKN